MLDQSAELLKGQGKGKETLSDRMRGRITGIVEKGKRVEQEKRSAEQERRRVEGVVVRRYESGEPIQLEVVPSREWKVEVRPDLQGERRDVSPSQIPLRLAQGRDEIQGGTIIGVNTTVPRNDRYFQVWFPLHSANGVASRDDVYVKPLTSEEARRAQESGDFVNYREMLCEKTKEMLEGKDVLRLLSANP